MKTASSYIIPADFPDLDIIRVDDTYYMVSTTMHYMPGCVILRSYNLVDWEHAAYVYDELETSDKNLLNFEDDKIPEAIKKYREYFAEKGLFENSVYPGIPELLSTLKQNGKKLVVATSKPKDFSIRIIEHFGLSQYFENVCGSLKDQTRTKKDEVIEFAIERNQISDKSKIMMIGDRKHDILGAKKVGLKSCGVLFGYGSREELETAGADFIAENVSRLDKICLQ